MRHGMANKKLNRTSEHRKALLKNMLNSLIKYEHLNHNLNTHQSESSYHLPHARSITEDGTHTGRYRGAVGDTTGTLDVSMTLHPRRARLAYAPAARRAVGGHPCPS